MKDSKIFELIHKLDLNVNEEDMLREYLEDELSGPRRDIIPGTPEFDYYIIDIEDSIRRDTDAFFDSLADVGVPESGAET